MKNKQILFILISLSFTFVMHSCKTNYVQRDLNSICNDDSLSANFTNGLKLDVLKVYNAISQRRYYIISKDNILHYRLVDLEKPVLIESYPRDLKLIHDLKKSNFQNVPDNYLSEDCYDCNALEYYNIKLRKNSIKILKFTSLTDNKFSYTFFDKDSIR